MLIYNQLARYEQSSCDWITEILIILTAVSFGNELIRLCLYLLFSY